MSLDSGLSIGVKSQEDEFKDYIGLGLLVGLNIGSNPIGASVDYFKDRKKTSDELNVFTREFDERAPLEYKAGLVVGTTIGTGMNILLSGVPQAMMLIFRGYDHLKHKMCEQKDKS